ncbi:unnamed protein product [Brassica rapa]|uniref:Uncharacterized protein n=1 Tax=Brassica campestris TaxID=3711 RepID=A0A3P5Z5S4_BRACM|nr:unnamed protein product [Brassica rapa]VDC69473.1 unnamed protein product [Brassica rapa]
MPGGVPKLPKIQPADIQAAVGWGNKNNNTGKEKRLKNLVAKLLLSKIGHGQCRPEIFRDAKPVPADESSQISIVQHDDGKPPLEANTNRSRPFGEQCDAETDSDS